MVHKINRLLVYLFYIKVAEFSILLNNVIFKKVKKALENVFVEGVWL